MEVLFQAMHSNFGIGILTFVPDLWETFWMPRHHIMSRLAKYYKVLWVTPPLYWRTAIHERAGGVKKISPSFWVYNPERYLPINYRFGGLNSILDNIRVRKIKSLLINMKIKRLILYIWRPQFAHHIGMFSEELVCYHIDDEYTFSDTELATSKEENHLIKDSDVVFIHSKTLLEKKGTLNPETYYVPNGVDFDYYRQVMKDSRLHLSEFDAIPKPRIGYIGIIKKQIDLQLLLRIAQKRKDWSIVLVGPINRSHPIQKDIELLQSENNVYFLGGKKPEELPSYIREMDVCLMCYNKTAYTKYIYPMKLHEYLACGKPVIATFLENLREFEDVLYFAEGLEDWIERIQHALSDSTPERKLQRIAVARENSWDKRVETIRSIIQDNYTKML